MVSLLDKTKYQFNAWTAVQPCEELQKLFFPFIEKGLSDIDVKDLPTARVLLNFMNRLRVLFLRDTVLLIHMERKHAIYELPVFQTDLFNNFKDGVIKFCNIYPNQVSGHLRR